MAEIETSVLRIESNDLVLQDAAARGSLAAAYSASSTYAVGDMVLKDGQLYECNTAITTAEAWTAAHWTAVTVGGELATVKDGLDAVTDQINATLITDTASGAIASFPDGADNVPVKSLTVAVEPVQNLNGQDAPYPAGGSANKLPNALSGTTSSSGLTLKSNGDGTYVLTGSTSESSEQVYFDLVEEYTLQEGDYLHIGNSATNVNVVLDLDKSDGGNIDYWSFSSTNRIAQISSAKAGQKVGRIRVYVSANISNINITLKPMICQSSTAIDFAPYSNICPISGHTSAVVTRTGKNLLKLPTLEEINSAPLVVSYRSIPIQLKPNTTYYLSTTFKNGYTAKDKGMYALITNNPTANDPWRAIAHSGNTDGKVDGTMATSETGLLYFRITGYTQEKLNDLYANSDIQLEEGSTATAYEPYSGQTYTIDLDGTRYGGTLDVTTGVLTVTHAYYQFTGSETINGSATNAYINTSAFPTPMIAGAWYTDAKTVCDSLPKTNVGKGIRFGADNRTIYFYDLPDIVPAITDKASLDAWIASQKPCITYPIESFTVQLSANEVQTLLGQNNIWADCGNVSVEYRADTKLYIEKLTAPTEDDMIADHAISANTFFMVGNTLYRATTAIASGATITVGTNATKMSLSDALNTLS